MTPTQRGRLETLLKSIEAHTERAYRAVSLGKVEEAKEQLSIVLAARQAASELVGSTN